MRDVLDACLFLELFFFAPVRRFFAFGLPIYERYHEHCAKTQIQLVVAFTTLSDDHRHGD